MSRRRGYGAAAYHHYHRPDTVLGIKRADFNRVRHLNEQLNYCHGEPYFPWFDSVNECVSKVNQYRTGLDHRGQGVRGRSNY